MEACTRAAIRVPKHLAHSFSILSPLQPIFLYWSLPLSSVQLPIESLSMSNCLDRAHLGQGKPNANVKKFGKANLLASSKQKGHVEYLR